MNPKHPEPTFVKILETNSLTDIALIKSVLDEEDIKYFLQGENMKFIRPVDPVLLMVAEEDVQRAIELLKPLKLNYAPMVFGGQSKP
ncbi:MAG: DUF2007 domain-containing protein [Bacteroidota bacterium]